MILLQIDWSEVGIKAGQLLLSLSILVVLHEWGHYITARWFQCRVEKFYLFFDPWFSIFKKKIGETEYGIGWLPLGGYVKIAGMIDESMDKEALAKPAQEWEFRSKPAWQRLIIMLGGIIVNVLLAILIFSMVLYKWGDSKIPMSSLKHGISFQDSLLYNVGFRQGDKILTIDGKPAEYLDDATYRVFTGKMAIVNREGSAVKIDFPANLIGKLIDSKRKSGVLLTMRVPAIIAMVDDKAPAKKLGLQTGDKIMMIDSTPILFFDEMKSALASTKNDIVHVQVERKGNLIDINTKLMPEKKLGIIPLMDIESLDSMGVCKSIHKEYSLMESFPAGFQLTKDRLVGYIDQFRLIFDTKTEAYKGLGGFKAMANAFPSVWDWESFWKMTGLLSIILAFMNLLPIPALDGGHVMFTLYEMITGRKPHEKFLEYAQMAGMILLLSLMVLANANDWIGWGK
jgi:regulator of sigma E protease